MAKHLYYRPCEKCQERGSDKRGDNKSVYSDGSEHCWSCSYHKFPTHYNKLKTDEEINTKDKAKLPNDFSRNIPARAWQWILQYGLGWKYWEPYCGYSEAEERFIITVGDPLDFSLGRDVSSYVSSSVAVPDGKQKRKWWAYGNCHEHSHVYGSYENVSAVVLTEDVISANKIAAAGHCALSLFGTNVHDCHLRTLRHIGLPVVMWLDKDQQGLTQRRAFRLGSLIGKPVRVVHTDNDPKELSFSNINFVLQN